MLTRSKEGKLCLEDADGSVELDFSTLVCSSDLKENAQRLTNIVKDEPGDGFFTEGSFALVEGEYTVDATLQIIAVGQPPCESRYTARYVVEFVLNTYLSLTFTGQSMVTLISLGKDPLPC